jgi:RNA recognition motif-containing protein
LEEQKSTPPPAKTTACVKQDSSITTYMIRNIPTRFTSITFVRLMEDYGFTNSFNFFYLPMDFRSGKNMGYAFINFVDSQLGLKFINRFNQRRLPVTTSKKVLEISPSRRQGLAENIALFRTSDLLNSVSLPHYKPLIATDQTSGSLVPLTETNFPPLRK